MYVLITNDTVAQYPYSIDQLRRDNPNVSFPADLTSDVLRRFGVYTLAANTRPEVETYEEVVEVAPVLNGTRWTQVFDIKPRDDVTPAQAFEDARTHAIETVKALRDSKEEDTALTPFGRIDTNEKSAKRLNALLGTSVAALVTGAPWQTISWTLADNTELVIDTPTKGLQLTSAVMSALNALHIRAKVLKAEINAITLDPKDPRAAFAKLRAIDVTAGWPG